jgi:magnesium chelatase subunit D
MRSRPFEPPTLNKDKLEKSMEKHQQEQQHQHAHKDPQQHKKEEHQPLELDGQQDSKPAQSAKPEEQIFEVGSPIDVRQINMPHKRDRIARRKTSGRRMNTLASRNPGKILAPEDAREWQQGH